MQITVSQKVREKLLNDLKFRQSTAMALGVTEQNVKLLADRNSDNLTKYAAVMFYKSTGLTDDEIFEKTDEAVANN